MTPSATPTLPYLALRPDKLDSLRESASDAQLGVAVRLVHYCIIKGYAGRIPSVRDWTARQWLYNTGVDTPPATDVAGLWHWEADALIAELYDHDYAAKCAARSAQCSSAARARWNADAFQPSCERISSPQASSPIIYSNNTESNTVHLSKNLEREGLNNAELSYTEWKAVMKKCHPSCSKVATPYFAGDVENAALEAYRQYPNATQFAELLTAFYSNTKIKERKNGIAFYRPTAQHAFFRHLGDIITHAQDWAKETKWKQYRHETNTHQTHNVEPVKRASAEDIAAFTSFLKGDSQTNTSAPPQQKADGSVGNL